MIEYDIQKLLLSGESQSVEFKEAKNSFPKDGMKTICSFANTQIIIDKFRSGRQYVYFIAQNQDPEFQKYNHIDAMYSLLEEMKRK